MALAGEKKGRLLTAAEVAEQLAVSVDTLAGWRSSRRFKLPYVRLGGAIRYRAADVEKAVARAVCDDEGSGS